jgi:hypothetical protein
MITPNFDNMTPKEVREWGSEVAHRAAQLGEVRATLIVNCERGTIPYEYDDTKLPVHNLVGILEALTFRVKDLEAIVAKLPKWADSLIDAENQLYHVPHAGMARKTIKHVEKQMRAAQVARGEPNG